MCNVYTIIINYTNPNDVYLIITVAALLSTGQRCRYIYLNTIRQRCIIIVSVCVCKCVGQTYTYVRLICSMLLKKKNTKDYFDNPVITDHAEDFTVWYYITYK